MQIFENFFAQIKAVLDNGVFGISLLDLGIILISIIFALLDQKYFCKVIVLKVKKIVKKPLQSR
jgi:uncharacterized membrane protein